MSADKSSTKIMAYAFGEIILVVAGILIALEVDNWDKETTYRALEQQYYQDMKSELLQDRALLQEEIDENLDYLQRYQTAKNIIVSSERERTAELAHYVIALKHFSDFRRSSSIYQTLINSGEIKHIQNKNIVSSFQSLERDYVYIERLEDIHREVVVNDIVRLMLGAIQFDPFEVKNPQMLFSYQFNNMFFLVISLIEEKNAVYRQAIDDIDGVINQIDAATQPT